ncbi:hypothetical protein MED121_09935 [Marinomonas sp. MED121]|nr:hypothetical protein MED121_09935 [Marinomonas sp. MED121]
MHASRDLKTRFLLLALVLAAHSIAMVMFEDMNWWQAFWLTMTSASTTGYGDISAASFWGQAATIVLIYGLGIALLAQIASDYIELRIQKKEMGIKGQLEWENMHDHLLIINTPTLYTESYLERLVDQICNTPDLAHTPIQFLTPDFPEGLPLSLRSYGAVHQTGEATNQGALEACSADKAKFIVVLSPDSQNAHSDSLVFDTLHRIKALNSTAYVLAEAVDDHNRARFKAAGANAVIRPVRAYPEMLVRSLIAPGTEQVLEDLFRHQGDHTVRLTVSIRDKSWAEVVITLMQAGIGTALGFEDTKGEIVTQPKAKQLIQANSLIVMVDEDIDLPDSQSLQALFDTEL